MRRRGILLHCDEALRAIEQIENPVTKNLVNMAFVQVIKKTQMEKQDYPSQDFDMLFFVSTLKDFFVEHAVIAQTLSGEKVGAWFGSDE